MANRFENSKTPTSLQSFADLAQRVKAYLATQDQTVTTNLTEKIDETNEDLLNLINVITAGGLITDVASDNESHLSLDGNTVELGVKGILPIKHGGFGNNTGYVLTGRDTSETATLTKTMVAGNQNIVGGSYGSISGNKNKAYMHASVVSGQENEVGSTSVYQSNVLVGGNKNKVSGSGVLVIGKENTTGADNNIVGGQNNTANGLNNSVTGNGNVVESTASMVTGTSNTVRGSNNVVGGQNNTVTATQGIAAGSNNAVNGSNTAALGSGNKAGGQASIAIGMNNSAEQGGSIAIGQGNSCNSVNSVCVGQGLTASYTGQQVFGRYNVATARQSCVLIVGGGSDSVNKRNLIEVDTDKVAITVPMNITGNVQVAGRVTSSGADYAEVFTWADGNPNGEDRTGKFVSIDGENISVATGYTPAIIGIVSSNPSIVGDKDLMDENKTAMIGLVGKLIVEDDGTCEPNNFVTANRNGQATPIAIETRFRVMSRIDANHVKVLAI